MSNQAEVLAKIDRWLASTGFPLEYAVVRVFQRVGFEADPAVYYRPADGGPAREVDVLAGTATTFSADPSVRLVVECKYAASPWVVLTGGSDVSVPQLLGWTVATERSKRILVGRAGRAPRLGVPDWLLRTPSPHGLSVVAMPSPKGTPGDRQSPYEAMIQVSEAARGLLREFPDELIETPNGTESRGALAVTWPVIVVRGGLFQARPDEAGTLKSEPIAWQRVIWGGFTGQPTPIDIVDEVHLEPYARMALEGVLATQRSLQSDYP